MLRVARSCSSFPNIALRGRFYSQPWFTYTSVVNNTLDFPEQKVFAGTESLASFAKSLKAASTKKPLIVTDTGLVQAGVPDLVIPHLSREGFEVVVTDKSQPNPSCEDVINLAKAYLDGGCDSFIGIGGGGPVDAMKIAAVLATQAKVDKNFKLERDGTEFIVSKMMPLLRSGSADFEKAFPGLYAIPTTAGTGSEGGKSSVIVDPTGQKRVYGHPLLMPKLVALDPQLTAKLPPTLTAATGIDALAHLLEAWFVPAWTVLVAEEGGTAGGYLTTEDIERCDRFALEGIELVVKSLPAAFKNGSDLSTRLNMQIAALFGAKAFRKGDLGGIHAAAHALGAHFHLHHGTAISRMMVPVLAYNEATARGALLPRFTQVLEIFNRNGYKADTLSKAMTLFLEQFEIPNGLKELNVTQTDLDKIAELAATDPCQTNPVPLDHGAYVKIFNTANE